MSNVIIRDQEVTVLMWFGEPVVTFDMVDAVHERPLGTARRNFNENRERFTPGKHYFKLTHEEASSLYENRTANSQGVMVLTKRGYLLLVKSFTDDLSWKVQEELSDKYFENQGIRFRRDTLCPQSLTAMA